MAENMDRREMLKLSGLAMGSAALVSTALAGCSGGGSSTNPDTTSSQGGSSTSGSGVLSSDQRNTLFADLPPYYPGTETLGSNEMRISFMGSSYLPRLTQACNSVFVELGNGKSFVFDAGSGVVSKYNSMQIQMSKMDKVFLTHLHGDHTSDLIHMYCFGCQEDRKSPLYIWGPAASRVVDPTDNVTTYDDGTIHFCQLLRELNRWHTESQSFVGTRYVGAEGDGYDIAATELDWKTGTSTSCWSSATGITRPGPRNWVAYEEDGVTISFFPAVHDRSGSISYRLDWNGRSMIFSGDTKPNNYMLNAANSGVDVLIHEIAAPPETWAVKFSGTSDVTSPYYQAALLNSQAVQENSHTPQKAFGYILSQLANRPRLAVATHFQAEDDLIGPAFEDIRRWYPGPVTFAMDFMVINVTPESVTQRRAVVSEYAWYPVPARSGNTYTPKYNDTSATNPYAPMAPLAQFDASLLANVIDPALYNAR